MYFSAFLLGLLQGLTEFLPVSSSGHLALLTQFFDADRHLVLVGHGGTLVALLLYLRRDLLALDRRSLLLLALGSLPLVPLPLLLHSLPQGRFLLGGCFFLTSALLFVSERSWQERAAPLRDSLFIGIFQALAILPGVSRSGATISAARCAGWGRRDAVRFSFLLAIPAIVGAIAWELFQGEGELPALGPALVVFCVAFGVGMGALGLALRYLERHRLRPFAWYCLLVGGLALALAR